MSKPLIFTHRTVEWWGGDVRKLEGVDYVELDVRKTADDILVVSHFRSLKNTVRRVLVDKNSYAELCKKTGKYVPKLEEIVEELNGKVRFNLDLKQEGMTIQIRKFIKRHRIERKVIIDSCYYQDLEALSGELPTTSFAYSFNYKDKNGLGNFLVFKAIGYFGYFALYPLWPRLVRLVAKRTPFVPAASIYWRIANEGVVSFFHDRDIPVYVWSVDKERAMRRMIPLGVDGIKTSKPELLKKMLEK